MKNETIKAWRQPSKAAIRFGYGAIHRGEVPRELFTKKDGTLKKWTRCRIHGERWNRY